MISKKKIEAFQKQILDWYQENKRDLPWRKLLFDSDLQLRDPYKILISEVMSQQTQLSRVVPKYEAWITKFPTVKSLAEAKISDILAYWSGLGYNRRALNLQKLAQKVMTDYNGVFPQTEKELLSLPGIGPYTARAILCFAFDKQVAVVDTNVRKVILTQVLDKKNDDSQTLQLSDSGQTKMTDKEIEEIATQLLPEGKAYEWNQALMDYAASVLKKEKIPIPKQSKFHGSRRYYRGQILKALLKHREIAVAELGSLIKKDFSDIDSEWIIDLLKDLESEGFIKQKGNSIKISS